MQLLKGIIPIQIVPMLENHDIDLDGIHRYVAFLRSSNVGGLWVLGSASEDINISFNKRLQIVRETVIATQKAFPLIVGTGLTAFEDILNFADKISDLEIHGIHLLPYDVKMGEKRIIDLICNLAERLPFPLWLYHNPKRGRWITDYIIREVKEHPNVGGIKVGGYNLSEMTQTLTHRSSSFDVVGAGGGQLFQMLSLGAEAHTTSEASVYPERFLRIFELFNAGRIDEARELQFEMIRLSKALPRTDNGEHSAEEKYMLSLRGICGEAVNPGYRCLTNAEKSVLRNVLKEYGFTWA